jgi:Niemann-Pick C1 protein
MCEMCVNCLSCSQYAAAEEYHCIWYGQCNKNDAGKYQNCPYEGPAKELEAKGQMLLKKWCPHFFESEGKLRFISCTELNQQE